MSRAKIIRILVIVALAAAVILLIRLHVAAAQRTTEELGGDSSAGRRLAEAWCAECHAIGPDRPRPATVAPEFVGIANLPTTTALSLKVFLRSDHTDRLMPNFVVGQREADDLVAYLLSLKHR
jgi:mono/diheme cytochrome c family protein